MTQFEIVKKMTAIHEQIADYKSSIHGININGIDVLTYYTEYSSGHQIRLQGGNEVSLTHWFIASLYENRISLLEQELITLRAKLDKSK